MKTWWISEASRDFGILTYPAFYFILESFVVALKTHSFITIVAVEISSLSVPEGEDSVCSSSKTHIYTELIPTILSLLNLFQNRLEKPHYRASHYVTWRGASSVGKVLSSGCLRPERTPISLLWLNLRQSYKLSGWVLKECPNLNKEPLSKWK